MNNKKTAINIFKFLCKKCGNALYYTNTNAFSTNKDIFDYQDIHTVLHININNWNGL